MLSGALFSLRILSAISRKDDVAKTRDNERYVSRELDAAINARTVPENYPIDLQSVFGSIMLNM
jgi:hypothetical protein